MGRKWGSGLRSLADEVRLCPLVEVAPLLGYRQDGADRSRWRHEALGFVADRSGRPAHLLEKDVWVVSALATLFGFTLGEHLVFKGGTSLSKVYGVIRRFSEDVDVT